MRNLPLKLAVIGGVATFLVALPVSIDVSRSNAAAPGLASTIRVGLKCDTAQAVVGRPGTPGSVAGVARRSSRRALSGALVRRQWQNVDRHVRCVTDEPVDDRAVAQFEPTRPARLAQHQLRRAGVCKEALNALDHVRRRHRRHDGA